MRIRRAISVAAVSVLATGSLAFASPAVAVEPASEVPSCSKLWNDIRKYTNEAIHYEKQKNYPKAAAAKAKANNAKRQYDQNC